jgi:hypothetical protein
MSAQIFPIVGAAPLVLPDPLPTQDVSDGTPGAATPATAIQVAGTDGTDLRAILTDTSGRQEVVGAAASGVAVAGNPVLIGGSDGTDARTLLTDNTGQLKILVENASAIATTDKADGTPGSAVPTTALQVAGSDGTDLRALVTDTTGRLENVGAAAAGAVVSGNPVLCAGSDTANNVRTNLTDSSGHLSVVGGFRYGTVIQKANAASSSSSTSLTCAFPSNVTKGNTIVVLWANGGAVSSVVTDSQFNQYENPIVFTTSPPCGISYARVNTSGANTVTITQTSVGCAVQIYEIQGFGKLDLTAGLTQNASGTSVSVTGYHYQPNILNFFVVACAATSTISTTSPTNLSADSGTLAVTGTGLAAFGAYSSQFGPPQLSAGATFAATLGTSVTHSACVAGFLPESVYVEGQVVLMAKNGTSTVVPVTIDSAGNLCVAKENSAIADGLANTTVGGMCISGAAATVQLATAATVFNGTTWDRERGNFNTLTGDNSTLQTGGLTLAGAQQTNYNARGAIITAILGSVTGTLPTLSMQLQWSPDGGTTWVNYGAATAAIAAVSGATVSVMVYPVTWSTFTSGAGDVQIAAPLPRTWRIFYTAAGTTPVIPLASVQVNYIL